MTPRSGAGRRRATAVLVVREAFAAFSRHRHGDTAAVLTYYGFLSFVPLLLLVSVVTSRWILRSPVAVEAIRGAADALVAGLGAMALDQIETLAAQRTWSLVGLLALFWSITPFAAAMRGAMARVFQPDRPVALWRAKLRDVLGALVLIAVFLLLVGGRILYGALARRLPTSLSVAAAAVQLGFSFALALGALGVLFRVFAPVRLRRGELVCGAVISAVLLLAIRPAFAAFLRYNPSYGFAFGSLKAVFLMLTWVYVSFAAVLLGAEITAAARRREVALLQLFLVGRGAEGAAPLVERHLRRFGAGEVLFREGDHGDEMYVLRRGTVRLRRGTTTLRDMHEGDYFGELAMLLDTPRSATAEAVTDGELVVIRRDQWEMMLREQPELALPLLRELAERLRATDAQFDERVPAMSSSEVRAEKAMTGSDEASTRRETTP
ncbi:MAG: YihY family inner membrane protein [Kiritimatiellae bacterium]|nr:YihY family inner membrane protein [Kiritimatiellia bacterium]